MNRATRQSGNRATWNNQLPDCWGPVTCASKGRRLLAAVKLVELWKLSSGRVAQLSGLPRVEFVVVLGVHGISPFSITREEPAQGIANT